MAEVKKRTKSVLTTKEAADYLGIVSYRTLEKWRRLGKGPRWILLEGNVVGYRISDLDRYLDDATQIPENNFVA